MTGFFTASDLSDFLGLPAFDGQDLTTARFLLELTESMIVEDLGMRLAYVEDDAVELDVAGGSILLLPELPVVDVTSVASVPLVGDGADLVEGTDYSVELGQWGRRGILRSYGRFWSYGRVAVTYSHGYTLPGDEYPLSGGYALPGAIKAVGLQAAARGFSNPTELGQEQSGRWLGTYREVGLYLTHTDKTALDPFRRGAA